MFCISHKLQNNHKHFFWKNNGISTKHNLHKKADVIAQNKQ